MVEIFNSLNTLLQSNPTVTADLMVLLIFVLMLVVGWVLSKFISRMPDGDQILKTQYETVTTLRDLHIAIVDQSKSIQESFVQQNNTYLEGHTKNQQFFERVAGVLSAVTDALKELNRNQQSVNSLVLTKIENLETAIQVYSETRPLITLQLAEDGSIDWVSSAFEKIFEVKSAFIVNQKLSNLKIFEKLHHKLQPIYAMDVLYAGTLHVEIAGLMWLVNVSKHLDKTIVLLFEKVDG